MSRSAPSAGYSAIDVYNEGAVRAGIYVETTSSTADLKQGANFITVNSATSGDSRGIYIKHTITGVGGGGDAFRALMVVDDVVGVTARGAHISLAFDVSGTITGLGSALTVTLHVPTTAGQTGSICAINVEIYSESATSDPDGATSIAFIRVANSGDATGKADVDDDAVLFDLTGFTSGSGKMWYDSTSGIADESVKVRTPSGIRYLALSDSTTWS